jgi:cellobiose phosphorylase
MLERSVYNWAFGVRFTLDGLQIKPCLPQEYANSEITFDYMGKKVIVRYNGYGNKVLSASVNGKVAAVENEVFMLGKITKDSSIEIILTIGK